jgi:hypothetical protein
LFHIDEAATRCVLWPTREERRSAPQFGLGRISWRKRSAKVGRDLQWRSTSGAVSAPEGRIDKQQPFAGIRHQKSPIADISRVLGVPLVRVEL